MPAWNKQNEDLLHRSETSYHGLAIGQTLTSTRMELMAWIGVLAIPMKSCYATDSLSMLNKANKLTKAVEDREKQESNGQSISKNNHLKKHRGCNTNGDLWQQAWRAVVQRGSSSQSLRMVKGHATKEDIQKGISNEEDKEGNDKSDKLADEGVESIQGRGLVKLASWMAERHDKYGSFMKEFKKTMLTS